MHTWIVNPCLDTNVNLFHTRYERTAYLPSLSYKWDWACVPSSTDHSSSNPFLVDIVEWASVSSSLIEPPSFPRWYEPQSLPRQYKRPSLSYERTSLPHRHERAYIAWRMDTHVHPFLVDISIRPSLVDMSLRLDTYVRPFHMSVPPFLALSIRSFVLLIWACLPSLLIQFNVSVVLRCLSWPRQKSAHTILASRTDGDSEHYRSCWRILIRPAWWWRYRSVCRWWMIYETPTIFFLSLFCGGAPVLGRTAFSWFLTWIIYAVW